MATNGQIHDAKKNHRWKLEGTKNVMIVLEIKEDLMMPFYVAITEAIKS